MRYLMLFLTGFCFILFTKNAYAISKTPTGVLTDIWGVQVDAFQTTSQKVIGQLSDSAMADVVTLYAIAETEMDSETPGWTSMSDANTLTKLVDKIYNNPDFRMRSGLASSLSSINSAIDEAKTIYELQAISELGQSFAKNAPSAAKELKELLKNNRRDHILRNLLEYGSGKRNGRIQAMLANINSTTHSNLFNIASSIYSVGLASTKTADKVYGALIYLTQKEIADEYADNISNGEWAKITLQDFVVKKWILEGKINDSNMELFGNQDIYSKDSTAFLFSPIAVKIFKASSRYEILTQAEREAITNPVLDAADLGNYLDFQISVSSFGTNKYTIAIPATIISHATYGIPTALVIKTNGSNIQNYPSALSAVQYIDGTSLVKTFDFDLSTVFSLQTDQSLDVTVTYSSGATLSSFINLIYTPQVSNVQLTSLPVQFTSGTFPVSVQYCGDIVLTATLKYKNSTQVFEDLQTQLVMQDPIQMEGNCRSYTLNVDGWKIFNYTGGNKDISIMVEVADQHSPIYTKWLVNQDDTDNDGLPDSWEMQYFGNLSQIAVGDFDSDGLSNYQEYLHHTDPTKAGATGVVITTQIIPDSAGTTFSLSNSYWSHLEQSGTTVVMRQDSFVAGNYILLGNVLDLNGHTLTVYGDFILAGGNLKVNNGHLLIKGNFRIQKRNIDGTFGDSAGSLAMTNATDYVLVGGSFWTQNVNSLTAGVLEIKGDFNQKNHLDSAYWYSVATFVSSDSHTVRLSGSARQAVHFDSPVPNPNWYNAHSYFNILEITNSSPDGVVFLSAYNVNTLISNGHKLSSLVINGTPWTLTNNETIAGDLNLQSSVLDLNGKNLIVEGNLFHSGGELKVNNGNLVVNGDYRIQAKMMDGSFGNSSGILNMTNIYDYILVGGNFIAQSSGSNLTAGKLEIKGDFSQKNNTDLGYASSVSTFVSSGSHTVKLSGIARQTVKFDSPLPNPNWSNAHSYFNILEINNSSLDGVVFLSAYNVNTLISNGHKLSSMAINGTSWTLTNNETIAGDLNLQSSVLDLNGKTVIVEGNFYHSGGELKVNGGRLIVNGDYRIQTKNSDGTFTFSNGYLTMTDAADYVLVMGNFVMQSSNGHSGRLTAGTLEIRGNFIQLNGNSQGSNFLATGTHRVILSGVIKQSISFADYNGSKFNILEITNTSTAGIDLVTPMYWQLQSDCIYKGDLFLQGSVLDLNGKTLTVEGNLIHSGGELKVNGGHLHVKGNYRIQTPEKDAQGAITGWTYGNGKLTMTNTNDYILVDGSFFINTNQGIYDGYNPTNLSAGTLEIKGNFEQRNGNGLYYKNFFSTGTHKVILSGSVGQIIDFAASAYYSHFNILEITNSSVNGIIFLQPINVVTLISNNHKLPPLSVNTMNLMLSNNEIIAGNLDLQGSVLDLNGKTLTVEGNLIQSGGELKVNGGHLHVKGDYRIQTPVKDAQSIISGWTYSSGLLSMTNTNDYVLVDGSFFINTNQGIYDGYNPSNLSAGTLEIKGNFEQRNGNGIYYKNFFSTGTHKVVFSGNARQTIDFAASIYYSHFNILEITNTSAAGIVFITKISVATLFNHHNKYFTITDPTSEFPDFDSDGVKDNLDSEPTNPLVWAPYKILTLTISGNGGGSVNSIPSGIACISGTCSNSFEDTTQLTLSVLAGNNSTFAGWSGACTGKTDCVITMSTDRSVTAIFNLAPKAMIGTNTYTSLFAAYTAALTGETIMTIDSEMPDLGLNVNTALANGKTVFLSGGYKADYKSRTGLPTYLKAPLKISSGTLKVDRLTIK